MKSSHHYNLENNIFQVKNVQLYSLHFTEMAVFIEEKVRHNAGYRTTKKVTALQQNACYN